MKRNVGIHGNIHAKVRVLKPGSLKRLVGIGKGKLKQDCDKNEKARRVIPESD